MLGNKKDPGSVWRKKRNEGGGVSSGHRTLSGSCYLVWSISLTHQTNSVKLVASQNHHGLKNFWLLAGELREHFAIQGHAGFFELAHKDAIRQAVRADGGVNTHLPQGAKFAFFYFAAVKSKLPGALNRGFGEFDFAFASPAIALGVFEDAAAMFGVDDAAFNSGHIV